MKKIPVVGFVSLGCPKALVDTERIVTELRARGYRIGQTYKDADLVIVNTCGFVNEAIEESIEAITEALKENGRVIVCGCLGGRVEADGSNYIAKRLPKVLGVTGPDSVDQVMAMVEAHLPRPHDPWDDLVPAAGCRLTPKHYAYLKISEGCNHHCTFCIIPKLRGTLSSRPIGDILREAENLKKAGVKELLVISQDTAAYGLDRNYRLDFAGGRPVKTRLLELCSELGQLGLWTRLHYVYPYPSVDAVVPLMAEGLILPYLDVPFQHAHPRVLKAMKRPASAEKNLERIAAWRAACPDITIRSTFIAGFPGETEEEFEYLLDFLREARLDRVGCFAYSPVEGAAANEIPGLLPDEEREERRRRFMEVQAEISREKLAEKIGRVEEVIIDEPEDEDGVAIGRTKADAPEIDGVCYVTTPRHLEPGDIVKVRITANEEHDLIGKIEE
ncbi:30S ribosomal protein S12 methylthiotransferase RimO [Sutterella megalosphaeroides]|uniref:Ribosomal protein uS12 methylthiotransferase RimO n=1 Tax=Sutterella megalosphaeroides TaxID=2494234 RepID=A0A2Z6IGN1_9BURK|nr:30S ribosomal protein S12 methylthiotransferase RimO [Sutterella megalosphaeroides]BBF23906.1 ribosomal protein S12 methylthiotransferase RimO [Sutterella megalosphaeroides]